MTERLARILETDVAIGRLSERVQGMMLLGQDRDELKAMTVSLARHAKVVAELCGDPLHFDKES